MEIIPRCVKDQERDDKVKSINFFAYLPCSRNTKKCLTILQNHHDLEWATFYSGRNGPCHSRVSKILINERFFEYWCKVQGNIEEDDGQLDRRPMDDLVVII